VENWLSPWKIAYPSEKIPGTAHASALIRHIRIILRFLTRIIVYNFPTVQNISARGSLYTYVILQEL
jgi:hypothetical protein